MDRHALISYLNDHLAGSVVGLDMARRYRDAEADDRARASMDRLVTEISADRRALLRAIRAVGGTPSATRTVWAVGLSWAAFVRSRLADPFVRELEDLESLCMGVLGKRLLWGTLSHLPDGLRPLPIEELNRLAASADRQEKELVRLRETRLSAVMTPAMPKAVGT